MNEATTKAFWSKVVVGVEGYIGLARSAYYLWNNMDKSIIEVAIETLGVSLEKSKDHREYDSGVKRSKRRSKLNMLA